MKPEIGIFNQVELCFSNQKRYWIFFIDIRSKLKLSFRIKNGFLMVIHKYFFNNLISTLTKLNCFNQELGFFNKKNFNCVKYVFKAMNK